MWREVLAIAAAIAGLGALALAVWQRRDRSASWPTDAPAHVDDVLLTLPGGGLMLLAWAGMFGLDPSDGPLATIVALAFVLGMVLVAMGVMFWAPMWFVPRWARAKVKKGRRDQKAAQRLKWKRWRQWWRE